MKSAVLAFVILVSNGLMAEDSTSCTGKFDDKNQKHGVWVCRDGNRVVKKERYKHGELITYIIYNEKGEIIESRDRKGRVRKFNPCGC